jgi:hypothetical protein
MSEPRKCWGIECKTCHEQIAFGDAEEIKVARLIKSSSPENFDPSID